MLIETDFSPIVKGNTPVLVNYFTQKASDTNPTGVFVLTGYTPDKFTMFMRNKGTGILRSCTGTWELHDASGGIAYYHMNSLDSDTPGTYVMYPDGPRTFTEQTIVIKDTP